MKIARHLLVPLLAVALVVSGGVATANASPSSGWIDGNGDGPGDDWTGEGVLCDTNVEPTGCGYRNSGATGLWQHYLTADGYLSPSAVDCYFGSATRSATIEFQKDHNLNPDGVVGPQTFAVADNALTRQYRSVFHSGTVRTVEFGRSTAENRYSFVSGTTVNATYATRGQAC